jgi:tetratricopeptide (TPR) repeat protein
MHAPDDAHRAKLVPILLAVLTLAVYWPVRDHEFLNFDDGVFVTENAHVQAGLTWNGIVWAFTKASYSCPLAYVSHMVDVELFGLEAGGHHAMNVLFHLVNTLLLYSLLRAVTGAMWPSAWVAAMFAWHPLHIQSVAWIAERRDVLSTMFWLLAMWGYVRWVKQPDWKRYAAVFSFMLLGLLTKAMLITLPFVLLLFDVWPLNRLSLAGTWAGPEGANSRAVLQRLVVEKLPLFALALAFTVEGIVSAQRGNLLPTSVDLPLARRFGNALVAWCQYLGLTVWPVKLSILYPHPGAPPLWQAALAALALGGATWWVWRERGARPWLVCGWFWYLGTLVPVIGIVQGGQQAIADRYTYVPLIGVFMALAFEAHARLTRSPSAARPLALGVAVTGAVCLAMTAWQLRFWKDSAALFSRAVAVTKDNHVAQHNLADALASRGQFREALPHYDEALRLRPNNPLLLNNAGMAFLQSGDATKALQKFERVVSLRGDMAEAHFNRGLALAAMNRLTNAAAAYREAIRLHPGYAQAHNNLGGTLMLLGQPAAAATNFAAAIRLDPTLVVARLNCAEALTQQGRHSEAAEQLVQFVSLRPDSARGYWELAQVMVKLGRVQDARGAIERAAQVAELSGNAAAGAELRRRGEQLLASPSPTNRPAPRP